MRKFLMGCAPLLAMAAFALVPSLAMAGEREPCAAFVLCPSTNNGEALRDDATEPPEAPEPEGGFGTDGLVVNTLSPLRLCNSSTIPCPALAAWNKNPKNDAFFGIKLHEDPTSANCHIAKGWVQWADIQNAKNTSGVSSPVFAGTSTTNNKPWNLEVRSDKCTQNPGEVLITNFAIYLPGPKWRVTSTATGLVGQWEQPGANCPAGGVKLNLSQAVLINETSKTVSIDDGAGGNAYLCFVSSNNYVYPELGTGTEKIGPTWYTAMEPLHGGIWKD